VLAALALAACAGHADAPTEDAASAAHDAGHLVLTRVDATAPQSAPDASDASEATRTTIGSFDAPVSLDGAMEGGASRFITEVLSFDEGTCAGFCGSYTSETPGNVLATVAGPPIGGGAGAGSEDVVSLGGGGSIVVGFGPNAIVDGPGIDFVVFENPFDYGSSRYVEPGEVSVSDDGVTWTAFPCTDTTQAMPDGGWGATQCAGMNLVYSNPYTNKVSPFDLQHAGGDQYDLATIGVAHARFVRIRNIVASEDCPEAGMRPDKNGFDLDAIAIIHASLP